MELTYPQKSNGLYVLSRMAIEQIATDVLKEYAPQNLEHPLPLDTRDMMENYLGLIVKHAYIGSFNSGILGLIVMSDTAEIPSLDEMFKPMILQECSPKRFSEMKIFRESAIRKCMKPPTSFSISLTIHIVLRLPHTENPANRDT